MQKLTSGAFEVAVFAAAGFCKIKTSKPRFETTSHCISETFPQTRFCENHCQTVATCDWCEWLLWVAIVGEHHVKISHVWVTAAIWFFMGVSGDVSQTKLYANRAPYNWPRCSRGHMARGQGHKKNPRPRSRTALPRTDPLKTKDRNARDQGQGPRTKDTGASVLQKKRSPKFFSGDLQKKRLQKNSSSDLQTRNTKKVFANFPRGFWRFPTKF